MPSHHQMMDILNNIKYYVHRHIIFLIRAMGALQIPVGTNNRSIYSQEGSILINQVARDEKSNPENEFIPVSFRDRKDLQEAQ